jgi:integrase
MTDKRIVVWVQAFTDRPGLVLQWHDPDTGRRKSKSAGTPDPDAAEQARADLEYELNNGLHKEAARMSWEKFRELFEAEYLPHARPRTRLVFENVLNLFEEICHPRQVRSVNERTVSAFAAGLKRRPGREGREGMAPSTVKVRLQFLHTVLTWAADQKIIPACPKFPAVKVPKKKPQAVPLESFERLLAKAEGQDMRAFLMAGWLAGLRLAEAFALEWDATAKAPYLDLGRNRIVLPAEFVKGVEDQWVPLDPQLREILLALPRRGRRVFHLVSGKGEPLTLSTVSDRVVRLAKKAGVKLTMKVLRRGFGCRYAGKVSAHVLQKLMRHASIKTTLDYYANIDAAVEEAVLGKKEDRQPLTAPLGGQGVTP